MEKKLKSLTRKKKLKLWFLTLFYHTSLSYDYAVDTLMEPMFWFVDHFTKFLGRIFVAVVVLLVTKVVIIAHMLGFPFWWNKSPAFTLCLIVLGYWIIINLIFNFYQVAVISPGLPIDPDLLMGCSVTVCKKCINPKPPRTHHCSICNRCYLNMDHHCPWVNNCVGHFNRRYFFMCMVYIVVGCIFIMLFGVELAFKQVILDEDILPVPDQDQPFDIDYAGANNYHVNNQFDERKTHSEGINLLSASSKNSPDQDSNDSLQEKACLLFGIIITKQSLKIMIYFAGLLCIGASLALGGLSLWHAKLITNGETSIEYHTNKAERKNKQSNFRNPYDLGRRRNWELFLGLEDDKITFWKHILLPSSHKPLGNGYDWTHLTAHTKANHS